MAVFFLGLNVRIGWDPLLPIIQLRHILTGQDFLRSSEWVQSNRDKQCGTKLVENSGKTYQPTPLEAPLPLVTKLN